MLLTRETKAGIKKILFSKREIHVPFKFDFKGNRGLVVLSYDNDIIWTETKDGDITTIKLTEQELWERMDRYLDPCENVEAGMKLFREQNVDTEGLESLQPDVAWKWYRQEVIKLLDKDR